MFSLSYTEYMKRCTKCGESKQELEFHKNSRAKDGLCSYCKVCAKKAVDLWKAENPERRQANQAKHFKKNKAVYLERRKERRAKNPEKFKEYHRQYNSKTYLKRTYGLTQEDAALMLDRQNNRCAICAKEFSESKKPVVDHCHKSGTVRELLCSPCNLALGHIEKDGFFKKALEYLKKHNCI